MDIDNIVKELESIKNNVDDQVKRIASKNKEEILDYIREKQLFEKGEDGKGRKLTAYKPFTIAYKNLNYNLLIELLYLILVVFIKTLIF